MGIAGAAACMLKGQRSNTNLGSVGLLVEAEMARKSLNLSSPILPLLQNLSLRGCNDIMMLRLQNLQRDNETRKNT